MKLQLKRSSVLNNGIAKPPTDSQMEYGELAVNYNTTDPALFIKDSANNIVRVSVEETTLQTVTDTGNTTTNDIVVTGDVAATTFTGDGSSLTGLPTTLQEVTDNGSVTTNTITATAFVGDGSALSGLPTSLQQVTDNGSVTTNTITANGFVGDGSGLTGLSAWSLQDVCGNGNVTTTGITASSFTGDFDLVSLPALP